MIILLKASVKSVKSGIGKLLLQFSVFYDSYRFVISFNLKIPDA